MQEFVLGFGDLEVRRFGGVEGLCDLVDLLRYFEDWELGMWRSECEFG